MSNRRLLSILSIWLIFFNLFVSCDLFTTREPEPPTGSSSGGRQFPRDPQTVMDNFVDAVGRRSSVDYMNIFSTDEGDSAKFEFVPDPESVRSFPGRFDSWDLKQEERFSATLFAAATTPLDSISYLDIVIDRETVIGDSAQTSAQYDLRIGHLRAGAPRQMSGRMDIEMVKGDDGGWTVRRWVDVRLAGSSCWSDLKAHF
jgi:hypothetical protein